MSSQFGSDPCHGSPRTFSVMFGQMQLLLQLGIDGLADQTKTVELFLGIGSALCSLVDLSWCKEFQRTVLCKKGLQSRIIIGSIAKQMLEMMGEGVQQFNHRLIVIAISWSDEKTHDHPGKADNGMQLEAEILHRLTAADAIVCFPGKVAVGFVPFIAYTGHGGRVDHCRLFQEECIQDDLQGHTHGKDHRPEIPFPSIVATAFVQSGKIGSYLLLVQAEKVVLSRLTYQLLVQSDGHYFTIRKTGGWTWTVQDLLNHG